MWIEHISSTHSAYSEKAGDIGMHVLLVLVTRGCCGVVAVAQFEEAGFARRITFVLPYAPSRKRDIC